MKLVIIESPGKVKAAKAAFTALGIPAIVIATGGSIVTPESGDVGRSLIITGGQPIQVDTQKKAKFLSNLNRLFLCRYGLIRSIIYATDPDATGEGIAFDVHNLLTEARLLHPSAEATRIRTAQLDAESLLAAMNKGVDYFDMGQVGARNYQAAVDCLISHTLSAKSPHPFLGVGRLVTPSSLIIHESCIKQPSEYIEGCLISPDGPIKVKQQLTGEDDKDNSLFETRSPVDSPERWRRIEDVGFIDPPLPVTPASICELVDCDLDTFLAEIQKDYEAGLLSYSRPSTVIHSASALEKIYKFSHALGLSTRAPQWGSSDSDADSFSHHPITPSLKLTPLTFSQLTPSGRLAVATAIASEMKPAEVRHIQYTSDLGLVGVRHEILSPGFISAYTRLGIALPEQVLCQNSKESPLLRISYRPTSSSLSRLLLSSMLPLTAHAAASMPLRARKNGLISQWGTLTLRGKDQIEFCMSHAPFLFDPEFHRQFTAIYSSVQSGEANPASALREIVFRADCEALSDPSDDFGVSS